MNALFFLNVKNDKIVSCGNHDITSETVKSYAVSEEVYYNYIQHEDRYKFEDGQIIEDETFPARFAQKNKEEFEKEFFNTSLGWIRRKVSMATGEKKDFLSDLLPAIAEGVKSALGVQVIAYNQPDYSQELTDEYLQTLQVRATVTSQFIQECFLQLSNDFTG